MINNIIHNESYEKSYKYEINENFPVTYWLQKNGGFL